MNQVVSGSNQNRHLVAWERSGELTERELEVPRQVAEGYTSTRIAKELDIVERTVNFHISNILEKLNVASRLEAAIWAKEQGIVP